MPLRLRPLHSLGHHADPTVNHRTRANRLDLAESLRLYYTDALADRLHRSTDPASATGVSLADRFVTRLEIAHALAALRRERADLLVLIELRYGRQWPSREIGAALHRAPATIAREIERALDLLIATIWVDELGGR